MQPHRSNALDGAAAVLTVALRRGVAVPLSWSWSHQPQGHASAAAFALRGTLVHTLYIADHSDSPKRLKSVTVTWASCSNVCTKL